MYRENRVFEKSERFVRICSVYIYYIDAYDGWIMIWWMRQISWFARNTDIRASVRLIEKCDRSNFFFDKILYP